MTLKSSFVITDVLTFYVSLDYLSEEPCNHIDHRDNAHHHELIQHASLDHLKKLLHNHIGYMDNELLHELTEHVSED